MTLRHLEVLLGSVNWRWVVGVLEKSEGTSSRRLLTAHTSEISRNFVAVDTWKFIKCSVTYLGKATWMLTPGVYYGYLLNDKAM